MCTQNVETLRRYYALLNESGEPALDLVHPEIEIHMFEGSPIAGPYRRQCASCDRRSAAVVVRFRDGLIARFDGYRERDEALAAAIRRG